MKQLEHLKAYKMKLTTLSPVFVGSGEKLSSLDYIYDFSRGELKLIDEQRFSKFLLKNNLLDDFMNYILNNKNVKLFEWGKKANLDLVKYDIFKKSYKYSKEDTKIRNDINLFIKNSCGNAYIPGTSLKGVIRTAILQKKLNDNPEVKNKYKIILEQALKTRSTKDLGKIEKDIEKDLICISMPNKFQKEVADVFRGIQVSDSKEFKENDLTLYKKSDYSLGDVKIHNLPIYRECIKPYTEVEFNITLDLKITKELGIDIEYIFKALEEFSETWHKIVSCFENEIDRFNIYLPSDEEDYVPNFCIGGGSGFLTKTIVYSVLDKGNAISAIKQYLDLAFKSKGRPAHKHVERDKKISPRTLKLAQDGSDYVNLGWCNISIAK